MRKGSAWNVHVSLYYILSYIHVASYKRHLITELQPPDITYNQSSNRQQPTCCWEQQKVCSNTSARVPAIPSYKVCSQLLQSYKLLNLIIS